MLFSKPFTLPFLKNFLLVGVEVLVLVLGGVCLCVCKRKSFCFWRSEYLALLVGVVCEASSCFVDAFSSSFSSCFLSWLRNGFVLGCKSLGFVRATSSIQVHVTWRVDTQAGAMEQQPRRASGESRHWVLVL